jgi:DNA-directed RNA polymerase subunit RPC12/RpoP
MSINQDFVHETTKQIVHCGNCGIRHIVIPPSKEYLSLMDYPCSRIDYQKSYYDCKKCSYRNIFYWHKKHREDKFSNPHKDSFAV